MEFGKPSPLEKISILTQLLEVVNKGSAKPHDASYALSRLIGLQKSLDQDFHEDRLKKEIDILKTAAGCSHETTVWDAKDFKELQTLLINKLSELVEKV